MGFFGVVRKDVLLILARPRDLLINCFVPMALAVLFGFLYSPRTGPASKIEVAVVDMDQSIESRRLTRSLSAERALAVESMEMKKAVERIERGKLTAAVILPKGLGGSFNITAITTSKKPVVPLLVDPSKTTSHRLVEGLLAKVIMEELGRTLLQPKTAADQMKLALGAIDGWKVGTDRKERWRTFLSSGIEALKDEKTALSQNDGKGTKGGFMLPVEIKRKEVVKSGGRFSAFAHSFAGMLVMFLFFISIDGGIAVIDERRRGTWNRLRTAPIGESSLLLSKVVSTFLTALLVCTVMFVAGILFFGIRIDGSFIGFVSTLILCSAVSAGFGLFLAGIGRTEGQVRGYSTFVVLLLAFLGGTWFPSWMLPGWLQTVSMGCPTRWMMEALYATTWRGLPMEAVLLPLALVAGFAVLFSAIGLVTFKWEK